jgi:hypothetical protein
MSAHRRQDIAFAATNSRKAVGRVVLNEKSFTVATARRTTKKESGDAAEEA